MKRTIYVYVILLSLLLVFNSEAALLLESLSDCGNEATGLCQSHFGSSLNWAFTYDVAILLSLMLYFGKDAEAIKLADFFCTSSLYGKTYDYGSTSLFTSAVDITTGRGTIEWYFYPGHNSYIAFGLLNAYQRFLDAKYYDQAISIMDDMIYYLQREDGGFYNLPKDEEGTLWASCEHQLDVWALLHDLINIYEEDKYEESFNKLSEFINNECMNADSINMGIDNPAFATDVYTTYFFATYGRDTSLLNTISYETIYTRIMEKHVTIDSTHSGFPFCNTGNTVLSIEWTWQVIKMSEILIKDGFPVENYFDTEKAIQDIQNYFITNETCVICPNIGPPYSNFQSASTECGWNTPDTNGRSVAPSVQTLLPFMALRVFAKPYDCSKEFNCSGYGDCVFSEHDQEEWIGKCECHDNYYGSSCNTTTCYDDFSNDTSVMSGCGDFGTCESFDHCGCDNGYFSEYCNITTCNDILSNQTDDVCSGHGTCELADQECECDEGYYGDYCNITTCYGDWNNETGSFCSAHGECVYEDKCECSENYFGLYCDITRCWGIFSNDTDGADCGDFGSCDGPDHCDCISDYFGRYCDEIQCYGIWNNDTLGLDCGSHGFCQTPEHCHCESDWYGEYCNETLCFGFWNNDTLSEDCGSHGSCYSHDKCSCFTNYYGDICDTQCLGEFVGGFCEEEEEMNSEGFCFGSFFYFLFFFLSLI